MPYDPYPMLGKIQRIIPSSQALGVNLEDPDVWDRPDITDYQYIVVHWGGGPNDAGWPIEEPALKWHEKVAVQLGRVFRVLRVWMAWHKSRGMSTIAYSTWVDSLYGRIGKLRGHRANGGQWGSINSITHAVALVMGFGQKCGRQGWEAVGLIWFCSGGPPVVGHRFFNDWSQTQTTTTCPGDENSRLIAEGEYVRALGTLRLLSRGRRVKAASLKLVRLGLLDKMYGVYRPKVKAAVRVFQSSHGLTVDGLCGPETWRSLAAEELPQGHVWPPEIERWRPLVAKYFKPEHVDKALGIIRCESWGDPNAVSKKAWVKPPEGYNPVDPAWKARGLFQQMPKYWEARAKAAGWEGADILDPEANVAVSAWLVYDGWHPNTAPNWQHWSGAAAGVEGCLEWANKQLAGLGG